MGTSRDIDFVNGRGQRLAATLHIPDEPVGVAVIVCHGMLSSRRSIKHRGLCEAFSRRGYYAFRFDFSGRGDSDGDTAHITYQRQVADLAAAYGVMSREADRIGLVGSSMGGAVAILFAASNSEVRSVAGIATVGRPADVLKRLVPEWLERDACSEARSVTIDGHRIGPEFLQSAHETDVIDAAERLACPLLLVHGDRDEVVPIDQARELAARTREGRLEVIAGGDHLLHRPDDQVKLEGYVGAFLRDTCER